MRESESKGQKTVSHYDANYDNFAANLYEEIRRETHDEDIGQNGWLSAKEQDDFISWLELGPDSRLLDVACGSGGPALRIARITGCAVHGVDLHEQGIAHARSLAEAQGLSERARFDQADASQPLPFPAESFDAITCIDAVNHLPNRPRVLADWVGLLKPRGRLLFTDPIVVTGILTNEEIAIRSSIGFFLFVPPGEDERLIEAAGLKLLRREDVTENMAEAARRWGEARAARAEALNEIEGTDTFNGQQVFFEVAARIAAERRLSRFVYVAEKAQ